MQIRKATQADIPAIVGMGARFYETTHYKDFAAYSPDSVAALAEMLIDTGILLIADDDGPVGMVGLCVAPFLFNASLKAAYEVVWWVNPEHRGGLTGARLLKAVEPAARDKGCVSIQMLHMSNSPPQAGQMYARMGYTHTESSWTKAI